MSNKVLIVEDDANIAELLHLYLEKEGFETQVAKDGGKGVELFRSYQPDLVLLDIMLPIMDGWSVLKKIREGDKTPVIMLTAKGETEDKVSGLEQGADDYIVKPFEMKEVLARIRAVLRRVEKPPLSPVLTAGPLAVDTGRRTVTDGERDIALTFKEFELLCCLIRNRGLVLTREKLLETVWGFDFEGESRTVDMHIKSLRQKLGPLGEMIQTVRGVGYKLTEDRE